MLSNNYLEQNNIFLSLSIIVIIFSRFKIFILLFVVLFCFYTSTKQHLSNFHLVYINKSNFNFLEIFYSAPKRETETEKNGKFSNFVTSFRNKNSIEKFYSTNDKFLIIIIIYLMEIFLLKKKNRNKTISFCVYSLFQLNSCFVDFFH